MSAFIRVTSGPAETQSTLVRLSAIVTVQQRYRRSVVNGVSVMVANGALIRLSNKDEVQAMDESADELIERIAIIESNNKDPRVTSIEEMREGEGEGAAAPPDRGGDADGVPGTWAGYTYRVDYRQCTHEAHAHGVVALPMYGLKENMELAAGLIKDVDVSEVDVGAIVATYRSDQNCIVSCWTTVPRSTILSARDTALSLSKAVEHYGKCAVVTVIDLKS